MVQVFVWMSVKKPGVLLGPWGFRVSGYVTRVYDYLFYQLWLSITELSSLTSPV